MANYMYLKGEILWAKVLGEPVQNYNKDGNEWTFDFVPDADSLKTMVENGLKDKIKGKGFNTGRTGQYADRAPFVRFVQKELRADGKKNDPITVVDARNHLWDPDVKIGNESLVEVKANVVDYGKGKPTGLYSKAIRVLDHKPFVRQEFEPLPEDSEYVKNCPTVEEFPEVNDFMPTEGDDAPVEGDPLDG